MGSDLLSAFRPALVLLALFTALLGLGYPLAILGIGQAVFSAEANGSLVRNGDRVVGSALIGQAFTQARYFQGRPSAAGDGYNAAASSGSNLGPTSKALIDRVRPEAERLRGEGMAGIPADMLTTSGSGLDPHISPATARAQIARVAAARGIAEPTIRAMVEAAIEPPLAGVLGEPRVNVLMLNRALDRAAAR